VELHLSHVLRGKKAVGFIVLSRLLNKSLVSLSSLSMQLYCASSVPKGEVQGFKYAQRQYSMCGTTALMLPLFWLSQAKWSPCSDHE